MQIRCLIFVIFLAFILGLICPVYANSSQPKTNEEKVKLQSRIARLLGRINNVEIKLPKITRKRDTKTLSLEDLVLKLKEIERARSNTQNPFKKIRLYLQESNIKRKISSLLKEKEEESRFEIYEEEYPIDYSPQALSEEGSIPPYIPVVIESFKEDTDNSGIFPEDGEEEQGKAQDKSLASENLTEQVKLEPEDLPQQSTSETEAHENNEDNKNGQDNIESKEENITSSIGDNADVSTSNEDQKLDSGIEGDTNTKEEGATQRKSRLLSIFSLFRKKDDSSSSKLAKLMHDKEVVEKKISSAKCRLGKLRLESKLRNINKKITRITESAIDTVTGSGEVVLE